MGDLNKKFCEGCKAEFTPATFSQGAETGTVKKKLAIYTETGSVVDGKSMDLCDTCYGKIMTWVTGKIKAAEISWDIDNPVVKTLIPPSL